MTLLGAPLSTLLPAAGAAAAALVALYLLKPARRRVEVPYARLWGLLARDARGVRVARRLRRWESLLLQLLIAGLILLALADPRGDAGGARPRHVILVDTSASMQARDAPGGPTRLDRARRIADGIVDGLRPDEEAMIVAFDAQPRPLSAMTADEPALRAAIAALRASDAPDALAPALQLARDALAGAATPRLTLIGDGGHEPQALAALADGGALEGVDVRFAQVGGAPVGPAAPAGPSENLGITAFSVRRYPANPSAYEILVEIRSASDHARPAQLTVSQEGEVVERTELLVPPRGRVLRRLADLSGEGRRLEARLEQPTPDALALDDRAYALLPDRRRTRVLLVGDGDLYTEGALLLDRAIDVARVRPAAYDPTAVAAYDAIVFDGFTPPAPPPRPALYLGCAGAGCPFATRGSLPTPIVTEVEAAHPLLRWVALKDLNVSRSAVFAPARGDVALASALGRPIWIAGERGGLRLSALGFSPAASDLPLRVAFPVMLVNAIEWLSGRTAEPVDAVRTGERARLVASSPSVSVTGPDGEARSLPARAGHVDLVADRAGYYTVDDGGARRLVAANLADPRESELATRRLERAGRPLPAPPALARLRPRAALWRWLAAAALLLVLLEWWSFHRRWTV